MKHSSGLEIFSRRSSIPFPIDYDPILCRAASAVYHENPSNQTRMLLNEQLTIKKIQTSIAKAAERGEAPESKRTKAEL